MKKIFMIGKFNAIFQDINHYLGDYFSVQVCTDNLEMIKGMLKLNQPELVIISLIGMTKENMGIFNELKSHYAGTPVICMGTGSEQAHFAEYLSLQQFHALTRPISNAKILEHINGLLEVSMQEEKGAANQRVEKKCILLIDDNATQLRTLNEMLKEKYDVQMATSAMKALTLIGKRVPDIIFLDYEMPMCDGRMTLQMIRELEEAKDIPIVFLTGVREKEHIKAVLELHPAGYLLKPASADVILDTIKKFVE